MLTVAELKQKLLTDIRWLQRGIVAIYSNQTKEEQCADATLRDNGIGFNGADAYILSRFAKQLLQHGRNLSEKQLKIARHKMPKYAGQLLKIAKQKEAKNAMSAMQH